MPNIEPKPARDHVDLHKKMVILNVGLEEEIVINKIMISYPIDYKKVTSKLEYYSEVVEVHKEASTYLKSFKWCKVVINSNLYLNLGSKLCVFLFEIENSSSDRDNFIWLVAGDLPPLYLDIYGAKTTKEVLEDYVFLANDWISKIELGLSINDCYPFNVSPTKQMARLLKVRTKVIQNSIIPNMEEVCLPALLREVK